MARVSPLCTLVVKRLEKMVRETKGTTLPSMRSLVRELGASPPIISAAAAMLRDRGLISFTRGQRIQIRRAGSKPAMVPVTSPDRIQQELRKKIESGELQLGRQLPKVTVFSSELHASNTTILQAFRNLQSKGLLHKQGRVWIVGPSQEQILRFIPKTLPPVILILEHKEFAWKGLAQSERTRSFCFAFVGAVEQYGIRMEPVHPRADSAPLAAKYCGHRAISSLLLELGDRYLGTLIIGSRKELPDLNKWMELFAHQARPVVWFDRNDEGFDNLPLGKWFVRCHYSEKAATDLAIEYLKAAGHLHVLHPICFSPQSHWEIERHNLLQKAGANWGIQVEAVLPGKEFVPTHEPPTATSKSQRIQKLMRHSPICKALLTHREATAIVASNDYTAYYLYQWLTLAGISIPRHLSMLSFDNYPSVQISPVTTVDFGFANLGYCAFHTLFGQVPVRRNASGGIPARPYVVERSSMNKPRKGPLRVQAKNPSTRIQAA